MFTKTSLIIESDNPYHTTQQELQQFKKKQFKQMKAITLIVLLLISINSIFAQRLKIELFNKTGYNLDSVSMGSEGLAKIKKDSSVTIHGIKEISTLGGLPIGIANGRIYEKKRDTRFMGMCGTGNKTVRKGHLQFDIIMVDGENGYRLLYRSHKKIKTQK